MPLFMDVHDKVPGLTAKAVAEAHQQDLKVQAKHKVKMLNRIDVFDLAFCFRGDDGAFGGDFDFFLAMTLKSTPLSELARRSA